MPFVPGHPPRADALVVGLIMAILGQALAHVRSGTHLAAASRLAALENELSVSKRALADLARLELADVFRQLHYTTSERITLFAPSRDRTYLRLVARWALGDHFRAEGRSTYPLDQGCLGEAWRNGGESWVTDLPDPQTDEGAWCQQLREQWSIPPETARAFAMKSRTIIAFAVVSEFKPCHGVIVFESQHVPSAVANAPNRPLLVPAKLRRLLKATIRAKLISLLEVFEGIEPKGKDQSEQ